MSWLSQIVRRVRVLARRSQLDGELDEEMRLHVDLREERLRRGGLSPDAASAAARRRFGDRTRLREQSIDAWGWRWLEDLAQDLRFGARTLVKQPGFAAAAILTLALATGATTAIFSVVNGVLLRPLPFDDPDRLVQVFGRNWREERPGAPDPVRAPISSQELEAYAASASFEGLAAYSVVTRHLDGPAGLERLNAVAADLQLFSILGVEPVAGRTFRVDDGLDVAVISARLWKQRFNGAASILGTRITLDSQPFTVIGVMPGTFQFPYRAASILAGAVPEARTDVWTPLDPLRAGPAGALRRGRASVVGRLRSGVALESAAAELRLIAGRVEEQYRGTRFRVGVRIERLADVVVGSVRRSLWMLFAAVGLVMAAACANVANLLLARMAARAREVVTRAALGAGRLRIARQFLAESLLLSLAGGLAGAAIARWGTDVLAIVVGSRIPRADEIALDWQAFAFLLLVAIAAASVFGLAPALAAARIDLNGVTKEAGGHATMGRRFKYLRDGLVVLEVALAFVLAVAATLVMREIVHLENVDTGTITENVVALHLTPRAPAGDYDAIEARVSRIPGVVGAGFIQMVPLQNWGWEASFEIRGRPEPSAGRRTTELRYVTPGYFRAMGIELRGGREFSGMDSAEAPHVVIVNEALARRYFPGEDPVGKELDRGTIAGVIADVRNVALDREAVPEIYYPVAQNVAMTSDLGMSLIVRTERPPESLIRAVRSAVLEVNPKLAIFNVRTMSEVVADSLWDLHLYRWLIGLFATLALVLAAIGLHGVISFTASARTREFAIRMALGSGQAAVTRLVVRRGIWLTAIGLGFGAAGAVAGLTLTASLRALRVGSTPDVATFSVTAILVLLVAAVACAVPALRAATVDPVAALRHE